MIIALDTSTMTCDITLIDGDKRITDTWEAGRELADKLIGHLRELLVQNQKGWGDVSGIVIMQGPGSFTGLRIGMTVANTVADTLSIPIVGQRDDDWIATGIRRLEAGENDKLVMPLYGRDPNITTPRK